MERRVFRVLWAIVTVVTLTAELAFAEQVQRGARSEKKLVTKAFRLTYLAAGDVRKFLEPVLSPRGKISAFAEQGRTRVGFGTRVWAAETQRSQVIAVRDNQAIIDAVEKILQGLDQRPQQVMIDVKIVEVLLNRDYELGINWNVDLRASGAAMPHTFPFPSAEAGPFTVPGVEEFPGVDDGAFRGIPGGPASAFTFGIMDATNLRATLRALERTGDITVLSSPRIATQDNQEASILIGEHFPILQETIQPLGGGTSIRTITLDHYEAIGIHLIVIPQILPDDTVKMIIHPSVSQEGAPISASRGVLDDADEDSRAARQFTSLITGGTFPRISTREAHTQVMVKDGETVVIGGLLEDRDRTTIRKVPILGDIPLIKRLFRHRTETTSKVELLIFATPRIVRNAFAAPADAQSLPEEIDERVSKKLEPAWMYRGTEERADSGRKLDLEDSRR
jgi:type II secretory pathway component GspD/PulD (secretin)